MPTSLDEVISGIMDFVPKENSVQKIGKKFFFGGRDRLYVIVPPWRASFDTPPMRFLKEKILKTKCSCLVYEFPIDILSTDVLRTKKYFKIIQKKIKANISKIKKKYKFKEIVLVGISLGNVHALMVANDNEDVDGLCLVVPGDSLAYCLWNGVATVDLQKGIEQRKINLDKLEKIWQDLAPKNNIDRLEGKDIEVYLSRSDKVIPYESGDRLVKDMEKRGLSIKVFKNKKLGHYLTALKFIFSKVF